MMIVNCTLPNVTIGKECVHLAVPISVGIVVVVLHLWCCIWCATLLCVCWRRRKTRMSANADSNDLNVSLLAPNDRRISSKGPADASSVENPNPGRQSELLPQKAKFFGKHLYENVAQVDGTALPIQMATLKREAKEFVETGSDDYTEVMEQRPPVSIPSPYIEPTNLYSSKVENKEESVHCIVPTDTLRKMRRTISGPALEAEAIYEIVESTVVKNENVPYKPPAKELNGLFHQLAGGEIVEIPKCVLVVKEHLASGQFGNIHKGLWNTPYMDKEVAVKTLKPSAKDNEKLKFLQEAAIMSQFKHPHIVKLFGAVTMSEPIMLILEYMQEGDLLQWLQSTRELHWGSQNVSPELPKQLLQFCQDIADGMRYLSNKEFIHRDLAARNILLDKNLRCKIADFGLSRDLGEESEYYITSGRNIPVRITDPEVLFYGKYSNKSDVWSYGMLVYEIWSLGRRPFNALRTHQIVPFLQTHQGYVLPPPPGCPKQVYHLMVKCWDWNHHNRPDFSKLVTSLAEDTHILLDIPPSSLVSLEDPKKASILGAPLISAQHLYKEFQQLYSDN